MTGTACSKLRGHWPHALLLDGSAGIALRFAQHLAKGLLCEDQRENGEPKAARASRATGSCKATILITGSWYPRRWQPRRAWATAPTTKRIKPRKPTPTRAKKTRAPSKEIKIEQIRGLLDFVGVGWRRGDARVVVLDPAELGRVRTSRRPTRC